MQDTEGGLTVKELLSWEKGDAVAKVGVSAPWPDG
jgi:hypothetical protein